jgi:tetratricopeptide (TPR) repeat protein
MRFYVAIFLASAVFGQSHKGHSAEDYRMTEMGAPPRMTGVGDSHMQITTKSAAAQAYFDQGLSLLHCFWDFEAYRAFKEASRLDPGAAMAQWGIAEAISDYKAMEDIRSGALKKAKELMEKASDHEQYYLRAQQKGEEEENGHDQWRSEMEALIDRYPDDVDAKLFLAIKSTYSYRTDGRPRKDTIYAQLLIGEVLHDHPNSAAGHHYRIHLLESSDHSKDALPDADALEKLAPESGHMVHMPGHIYYDVGDYNRARQSFLGSMKVDEQYMQHEKVGPLDDWNYPHNLSYLIAADAESGRYREALEMASRLEKLPANPFLAKGSASHVLTVGGTKMRLHARYGNWQAMAESPIDLGMTEEVAGAAAAAYRDGMVAYAKGMLALSRKDVESAERQSDALDAIAWRLHSGSGDEEDKHDRAEDALRYLEMTSLDLRGNLRSVQGRTGEAIELLKKALDKEKEVGYREPPQYGRPEFESLGYAYIRTAQYDKAREAFQDELKLRPKNGHALYGIAQTYEASGDKEGAARAYREFLAAWQNADDDLAMVKHAQSASH